MSWFHYVLFLTSDIKISSWKISNEIFMNFLSKMLIKEKLNIKDFESIHINSYDFDFFFCQLKRMLSLLWIYFRIFILKSWKLLFNWLWIYRKIKFGKHFLLLNIFLLNEFLLDISLLFNNHMSLFIIHYNVTNVKFMIDNLYLLLFFL